MKRIILFVLLVPLISQLYSQEIHKTILSEKDPFGLYLNDGESDTLFYYDLTPDSNNGTVLILLSGFSRNTKEVFQRTDLPNIAYKNNITTLIPSINSRIHSDTSCFNLINKMLVDYSQKKNIEIKNIVIGGLSAGGILALTYTEWMKKNPIESIPSPIAVFTVDSPVDLYSFWYIEQRAIERKCSEPTIEEAKYVINYFRKYLGGSPEEAMNAYKEASPYFRNDANGGNAYYLKDVAVRAYCEPDIQFHLNRCEDYYDMNSTDLSSMINKLRIMGNEEAELITTVNKGYRLDGKRHPHSWSILDSNECVEWIKKVIENQ